jgi:hypothetical protein
MKRLACLAALAASFQVLDASAVELSRFRTMHDTDWTQAGLGGMRGVGEGAIELTGITGTVSAAYLYWHGPTSSNDPASNAQVVFGDTSITGTNIGTSGDNFWDAFNSQAYRADVTTLVTGNGSYALSGFFKEHADVNGASLIVFFDDGNAANNRDVVLLDGNDANWDNPNDLYGWTASLPGLRYIGGEASVTLHVSDGQDFPDGDLVLNGATLASGAVFEGNSTAFAAGGVDNGRLWDIATFSVTSALQAGGNALFLSHEPANDALSLVVMAVDLPVGAAPPVPEPSTYALMLAGILGVGWGARRQRR